MLREGDTGRTTKKLRRNFCATLQVLKKGGIVVSTLEEPSAEELARYGVRAGHVIARGDAGQIRQIAVLIDSGYVMPIVEAATPRMPPSVRPTSSASTSPRWRWLP